MRPNNTINRTQVEIMISGWLWAEQSWGNQMETITEQKQKKAVFEMACFL